MTDRRNHDLCDELESQIRTWVAFASGDDAKLSTKLYSEVLTETYLAERGWAAINDYLNPRIGVLDFLVASKVISPQQYTTNPEESVQALLRNARSLGPRGCSRRCVTGSSSRGRSPGSSVSRQVAWPTRL